MGMDNIKNRKEERKRRTFVARFADTPVLKINDNSDRTTEIAP